MDPESRKRTPLEEPPAKRCDTALSACPTVSVILPTLNSAGTLEDCLRAIRSQDYPPDRLEIVVADAGSSDPTLDIARRYGADRVVANPLRTGEAGKAVAIHEARGELLALIDSDNVLPDPGWLRRMVEPFRDPAIFAAEPLSFEICRSDPAINRYFALLGMNDPLCLFLGNYDRQCAVTGRWTGLALPSEDRGGYLCLDLARAPGLPTLGANGCLIRRAVLSDVSVAPYYFDLDVIHQLVAAGHTRFAKVRTGIHHRYVGGLREFRRKQSRRIRDFLHFSSEQQRSFPWRTRRHHWRVVWFCLATVTVLPLCLHMFRGARRVPDRAWLYHLPVCWTTLLCYGWAVLRAGADRGGGGMASRSSWQLDGSPSGCSGCPGPSPRSTKSGERHGP